MSQPLHALSCIKSRIQCLKCLPDIYYFVVKSNFYKVSFSIRNAPHSLLVNRLFEKELLVISFFTYFNYILIKLFVFLHNSRQVT